uniref:dromaiocalcin-1-like n=1 Tax=Scatophagus argus TaxID=75038 RepID=UPI001ED8033D|nr:dromaiocalcin-1-like [Scatophagus argus]
MPFFCFNLIVVEHKMTWEEAVMHCRQTHTTLTSLASETEHLLALNKIRHDHITKRVWIGLRYLEDRWLWVDGNPLEYWAWPQGGDQDHQCPMQKRCGALTKEGVWEAWDCQDKLNFICY